ncbi:CoA-transferase subunit beta [Desulfolucanica intricata]|uniref:CoA-transferase subunit beta n=1 Tax=Desulfolucanica intricata TaxID=1285191 RepID=UPI0008303B08|nr:CoA-transferase [Desulfolucanica intricata]
MLNNHEYTKPGEYKVIDLLAVAGAREISDGEVVFAGTGLPMLAVMLAQKTNSPNASVIYEAGSADGKPAHLPASVGDARCEYRASISSGLADVFGQLQRGSVDVAFLGGAEIDKYGNVNTTVIGDYLNPKTRFTGSGGNPDINALAKRTVFIMVQEKRRFREAVDYITSPGWRVKKFPGGEFITRQEAFGKSFRGGPSAVITNMAVFRFDQETGLMYLDTYHPGYSIEDVKNNVGFDIDVSRCSGETKPPTYHEIHLLYNVVDPEGLFLP